MYVCAYYSFDASANPVPCCSEAMIDDCTARKATVIISSQTPDNPYDGSTTIIDDPPRVSGVCMT